LWFTGWAALKVDEAPALNVPGKRHFANGKTESQSETPPGAPLVWRISGMCQITPVNSKPRKSEKFIR